MPTDLCIQDITGFVLVYSVMSRSSFSHIETIANQIKCDRVSRTSLMVLVGNKCDNPKREVSEEEGAKLADKLHCKHVETSARHDTHPEEVFYSVVPPPQFQLENIPIRDFQGWLSGISTMVLSSLSCFGCSV